MSMVALCFVAACEGAAKDGGATDEDGVLYLEVEALVRGSCALTRCHGLIAGAGLELLVEDLTKPLPSWPWI